MRKTKSIKIRVLLMHVLFDEVIFSQAWSHISIKHFHTHGTLQLTSVSGEFPTN